MTFESSSVEAAGPDGLKVTGKFSLHGVTKAVTIDVDIVGAGRTMFGDTRSGLDATLTISRSDYGVNGLPGGLGDEIRFTLSLEGILQR